MKEKMKLKIFTLATAFFILMSAWLGHNIWQLDMYNPQVPPIMWLALLTWIFSGITWLIAMETKSQGGGQK